MFSEKGELKQDIMLDFLEWPNCIALTILHAESNGEQERATSIAGGNTDLWKIVLQLL